MKAFLNPLLLLTCILLLAFGYASQAAGSVGTGIVETWVLTLCLMGVIINGTLGTARAMTGQPSVQTIGWAVGFLVFGSVVWTLVSGESNVGVSSQERTLLRERAEAWRAGQLSPFEVDENGDCVLTLAAGLGKKNVVADVLADASAAEHAEVLIQAAHRAAERNREQTLQLLLAAGVPADARQEGITLLHTAALNKARRAAACLLEHGAPVNATTADGSTPLHQAVLTGHEVMVRLLLRHGADPKLQDADGRDAASYARREGIIDALAPQPAPVLEEK